MKNKDLDEILETIKEFKWIIKNIWVNDNCIYAEVEKPNGKIEEEGLYAGSESDLNDVYEVLGKLKYIMNFNGMLNNDNIMI